MAGRGFKIPEVLTREEQEALLRQPNPRYPTGERNRLLLRVMLDTGLRLSEAINLRWRDLDLLTGRLHVKQGKGAKDRVLRVGDEARGMNHELGSHSQLIGFPIVSGD